MEDKDEEESVTPHQLTVDEVLNHIGEFGLFQKILDGIFFILSIPMSYQIIIMYLLTINPPWSCIHGSRICIFNGTFPSDDKRRCGIPRNEWQYTKPREFSIVTEFDIYCETEWILHLNSSILFAGWGIGAFFMGWVGNKYGRKVALFPSIATILTMGLISSFLGNLFLIMISRFIVGFCIPGTMYTMFLLISELVGSKQRPLAGLLLWVTLPIAFSILAVKAYFVQRWRDLSVIATAPYLPLLTFYWFVPDSFKWQLSQGKTQNAMQTINRISEWNKSELPGNVTIIRPIVNNTNSNPFDIFTQTSEIAIRSLGLSFIWLFLGMAYYGLYFAADDMGGSTYRDLFILSISEVPSSLLSIYICDRWGRKPATIYPLLVGAILCMVLVFIPSTGKGRIEKIIVGMIGKFFISTSFSSITTWTVEIFPVDIRSGGIGFMQISSRIGSASAPWVAKCLKMVGRNAPFAAMGVVSFIGFGIGVYLPETKSITNKDGGDDVPSNTEQSLPSEETNESDYVNK